MRPQPKFGTTAWNIKALDDTIEMLESLRRAHDDNDLTEIVLYGAVANLRCVRHVIDTMDALARGTKK